MPQTAMLSAGVAFGVVLVCFSIYICVELRAVKSQLRYLDKVNAELSGRRAALLDILSTCESTGVWRHANTTQVPLEKDDRLHSDGSVGHAIAGFAGASLFRTEDLLNPVGPEVALVAGDHMNATASTTMGFTGTKTTTTTAATVATTPSGTLEMAAATTTSTSIAIVAATSTTTGMAFALVDITTSATHISEMITMADITTTEAPTRSVIMTRVTTTTATTTTRTNTRTSTATKPKTRARAGAAKTAIRPRKSRTAQTPLMTTVATTTTTLAANVIPTSTTFALAISTTTSIGRIVTPNLAATITKETNHGWKFSQYEGRHDHQYMWHSPDDHRYEWRSPSDQFNPTDHLIILDGEDPTDHRIIDGSTQPQADDALPGPTEASQHSGLKAAQERTEFGMPSQWALTDASMQQMALRMSSIDPEPAPSPSKMQAFQSDEFPMLSTSEFPSRRLATCPAADAGSICKCSPGSRLEAVQSTCTPCPAGEVSPGYLGPVVYDPIGESTSCNVCPSGKHSASPASQCDDCLVGKFADTTGTAGTCAVCHPGKHQNQTGATFCFLCEPGTAQSYSEKETCDGCAKGRYTDSYGKSTCLWCLPGTFQSSVNQTFCSDCGHGEYASIVKASECESCDAGTVQAGTGASMCDDCLAGTYQGMKGETACLACAKGRFAGSSKKTACSWCQPGKAQPSNSSFECEKCLPGEYQNSRGKTLCLSCAAGKYASGQSSSECEPCGKGMYNFKVGSTDCSRCTKGNYTDSAGMTHCLICPGRLTTEFPGAGDITECSCPPDTHGLRGVHENVCEDCPPGFLCPGTHAYGDNAIDTTPRLLVGYMSLPSQPLRAFTCQGKGVICPGLRPPMFNASDPFSQVCAGGRIGQACAACPDWHFKTDDGCSECRGFDKVLFFFSLPCFFWAMVCLHVWWNRPSVKERADQKAAVVCLNLYFLYVQILGVLQTAQIDWKPPFSTILDLTSYMRLRVDFLKPSCGLKFSPFREYVTRGFVPLFGICSLYSVFLVCYTIRQKLPDFAAKYLPAPMRKWRYFINTTGAIYILFSCGITLTAFLPHQCIDNPGGFLTNQEWPLVLCEAGDTNYAYMTIFSVFLILLYVMLFPLICVWQVIRYPVAVAIDPHFFVKYKFLFGNYNADARYFGLIIMLRNVVISLISVFLMRDTFFQVICMVGVMMCYLVAVSLAWPWQQLSINRLDIMGCLGLCGIMTVGSGFVEQDVNQASLLFLLSVIFLVLVAGFAVNICFFVISTLADRRDFTIFLSHAKGTGGAVARLFKTMLASKLTKSTKIFLDSDNLVSLYELHVFVQHTKNLVLLLTPNCYAREWVAVELVTAYVHNIHVTLMSVNGGPPPDKSFLDSIPNVFRSTLEGRFPQMGINAELLVTSYAWIAQQPLLEFDVYSSIEDQEALISTLMKHLALGSSNKAKAAMLRTMNKVQRKNKKKTEGNEAAVGFLEAMNKMAGKTNSVRVDMEQIVAENTRVFLCKEKGADVQQEASVICLKLILKQYLAGGVFMPSREANFMENYEVLECLGKGCMLVLCLTKKVLCEADSVGEIAAAVQHGLFVVPVQVDYDFPFPGDSWYEQLQNGEILHLNTRTGIADIYRAIMRLIRTVFEDIAVAFNANGSEGSINSAGKNLVNRYEACQQQSEKGTGVAGQMSMRLQPEELEELKKWVSSLRGQEESTVFVEPGLVEEPKHLEDAVKPPATSLIDKPRTAGADKPRSPAAKLRMSGHSLSHPPGSDEAIKPSMDKLLGKMKKVAAANITPGVAQESSMKQLIGKVTKSTAAAAANITPGVAQESSMEHLLGKAKKSTAAAAANITPDVAQESSMDKLLGKVKKSTAAAAANTPDVAQETTSRVTGVMAEAAMQSVKEPRTRSKGRSVPKKPKVEDHEKQPPLGS